MPQNYRTLWTGFIANVPYYDGNVSLKVLPLHTFKGELDAIDARSTTRA